MKTTIDIPASLFAQAKQQASQDNVTLKLLVEEGLRLILDRKNIAKEKFQLRPLKSVGGGMTPEFQSAGWDRIRDAIYD